MVFQLGRSAIRVVPRVVRFLDALSHGARRPIHLGALAPALLLEDREQDDPLAARDVVRDAYGIADRPEVEARLTELAPQLPGIGLVEVNTLSSSRSM